MHLKIVAAQKLLFVKMDAIDRTNQTVVQTIPQQVNESEEKRSILHAKLCRITNYVTFIGATCIIFSI